MKVPHIKIAKWRKIYVPPSKNRPQAEILLAATFLFDRFLQYPLSNLRGHWRKRSIFLCLFLAFPSKQPKKQEKFKNCSFLNEKWRCNFPRGPPPKN